ncbi:17611_t:CDS:2, partial [Acaulospora colombiana]
MATAASNAWEIEFNDRNGDGMTAERRENCFMTPVEGSGGQRAAVCNESEDGRMSRIKARSCTMSSKSYPHPCRNILLLRIIAALVLREFTISHLSFMDGFEVYQYQAYSFETYSASSAASSPHLSTPSPPQYQNYDFGAGQPYSYPSLNPFTSGEYLHPNEVPISIAPHELHEPDYLLLAQPEPATDDYTVMQAVMPPESLVNEQSQSLTCQVAMDLFPMKKDRQRGNANLLRSVSTQSDNMDATCAYVNSNVAQTLRGTSSGIRVFVLMSALEPLVPFHHNKSSSSVLTPASVTGRPTRSVNESSMPLKQAWNGEQKKNRNRSQKSRGLRRYQKASSRDSSLEANSHEGDDDYDDSDDADYR